MAAVQLGEEIVVHELYKKTLPFQKNTYHSSNYIKRIPNDNLYQNLSQMN